MRTLLFPVYFLLLSLAVTAQIDVSETLRIRHPLLTDLERQVGAGTFGRITSILLARDGKLIYERYFEEADSNSTHNTRSATKSVATLLTGIAMKQGYITSEQDPIFKFIQPTRPILNPDPRKGEITLEDLLSMSSILECDDDNMFSRGHEERMYLIEDWLQFYIDLPVKSYTFGPPPEEMPYGRSMSYCSAGAAAIAELIQAAVGVPLHTYAKDFLFTPLGIRDYTLHFTPTGTLNTAGGSEYRSRDLLKLGQLLLQDGKWGEQVLMDPGWVKKATTPKANAREGTDYGYLLWISKYGKDQKYPGYAMAGNGGQRVLNIPALGLSIVITTTNYGNREAHAYSDQIINSYLLPALTGEAAD